MSDLLERNPGIVWREEPAQRQAIQEALERGEEASERGWVILIEPGTMHELNLMAGEIWLLADGTRDTEAVARELAGRYDAPAEEIAADVEEFVASCLEKGWLRTRRR